MGMTRSKQMATMKARNTKPERRLRSVLWARGLRYRLHRKTPVGRPDLVFPRPRVAVFVDGCYWHGCPDHYVRPRTRHEFWAEKLEANIARDRRQTCELENDGWLVVRVWEHEVDDAIEHVCDIIEQAVRKRVRQSVKRWRVHRVDPIGPEDRERRYLVDLRDERARQIVDSRRQGRGGPRDRTVDDKRMVQSRLTD